MYYLPKLSVITSKNELKSEVKNAYYYLIPWVVLSAGIIYLMRDLITYVLFTEEFLASIYLYAPQLVGDVFKIGAFIFSYIMLAKSND